MPPPLPALSSSGGGGGSAISSMVPTAGSSCTGEPWRPTDLRFKVRCRSSRKFGCPPDPFFGDVGGEMGGGFGMLAFFSELLPHEELLSRETGGGGGGACGCGFTTATTLGV